MKLAIIGRTEFLYNTALLLKDKYKISVVITSKAAPEYKKTEKDFEQLAKDLNVPFFTSLKDQALINFLKKEKVDLGISVNWPTIIKQDFIDLFRLGILNAHMGDLPKYRGNAVVAWAILNGEEKVVLSIHFMEGDKLDCGRIVYKSTFFLSNNTYIGDVYKWAEQEIPFAFMRSIEILKNNPNYVLKYVDENDEMGFRCYPLRPEDFKIDWTKDAEYIHRLIRANSKPYSGAFSFIDGKEKIIIWKAELYYDNERYFAIPGQISKIQEDYFIVITGKGKLKITEWESNQKIKSIRQRLI